MFNRSVCEAPASRHPTPSQCYYKYTKQIYRRNATHQPPPRVSGLGGGAELLTLPLRLPPVTEPSSALRSRKPVHRSASDSLVAGGSVKNSLDSEGVLGVRWNGELGKRKLLFDPPGLARPACSFCSSVQLRSAAINCKIWNFFGSDRSRARKCRKWLVTICLQELVASIIISTAKRTCRCCPLVWPF